MMDFETAKSNKVSIQEKLLKAILSKIINLYY